MLDEDISDRRATLVSLVVPALNEAESDEAEEEETLIFAGKKKGKKGKKEKKASNDDEDIDALIGKLEGHTMTEGNCSCTIR